MRKPLFLVTFIGFLFVLEPPQPLLLRGESSQPPQPPLLRGESSQPPQPPLLRGESQYPQENSTRSENSSLISLNTKQNTEDYQGFQSITNEAISQNLSNKSIGEIMQNIALKLLGSKYEAGLLDQSKTETLFVSLTKFDCVLFVENVLALTRGIVVKDYQYSTFVNNLTEQRYRDGKLTNYCSRLHYFSEWVADNEKRGHVQNITGLLGGVKLDKQLNFMTKNRSLYPQLANNNETYKCIENVEKNLYSLDIKYIPTAKIKQIYSQLKPGDIVGIVTSIEGLDVTHTGLIYRQGANIGLIHASPAGKVTIASDLQQYVSKVNKAIGITVARPL
jgi:hypothetical protein